MTVDKITNAPTQKELIDKTNEIIDNLGGGITVDQTYNGTSVNAQSGVAIAGAGFLKKAVDQKYYTNGDLVVSNGNLYVDKINLGDYSYFWEVTNSDNLKDLTIVANGGKIKFTSPETPQYIINNVTKTPVFTSDLSTVATSGSYDDLTNKPTIPDAQVQSNWNETSSSSKAYIQNKPSLSTVATSGSYTDLSNKPTIPDAQIQSDWSQSDNTAKDYIKNKPTIPAAQVQANWNETNTSSKAYIQNKPTIPDAQIQSDWNQTTTTAKDYIKNKPTIPTVPTNVSAFTNDAGYTTNVGTVTSVNNVSPVNGNVSLTIPTNTNQLTNGAGFITSSDLSGYQLVAQPMTALSSSGSISLSDNTIYKILPTGTVTFTLPTITDTTKLHQIFIQVTMSSVKTINLGTTYYFNKTAPNMSTAGGYNLLYEYDNYNGVWIVGCVPKGMA